MNDLMMLIHRMGRLRDLEQINTHTGSLGSFDLSLLDQFMPDTIIHMARMSGRGRIGRYLAALLGARANTRIINHLKRKPSKPHIIYVSGTLVYGDCGKVPADEEMPIHPTAFAREYIKAEKPWMAALRKGEIPVTILRPPWIIGKGSWFAGFYLNSIRDHRVVPLFGDGQNLMSLIDVEDCAGLIALAVRNSEPGRYYNLFVPGACITQLEFTERLAKCTGTEIRKLSGSEVKTRYGESIWEAFTFSNISSTKHPKFLAGYTFKYPSIDEMISNNLPAELYV
jgi:nucleoside-diphosphate-sugar epimerase